MKRTFSILLHTAELAVLAGAMTLTGSVVFVPPIIVAMVIPAAKLANDIEGNTIKKSIFSVNSKGVIRQQALAKPLRFISLLAAKDKQEAFFNEATNMFLELPRDNKKGDQIVYSTKSQSLTLFLLRKLKNAGYIEGLEFHKASKSRLITEKITFGNAKAVNNKEHQMFDIKFKLTDKERTREGLEEIKAQLESMKLASEEKGMKK